MSLPQIFVLALGVPAILIGWLLFGIHYKRRHDASIDRLPEPVREKLKPKWRVGSMDGVDSWISITILLVVLWADLVIGWAEWLLVACICLCGGWHAFHALRVHRLRRDLPGETDGGTLRCLRRESAGRGLAALLCFLLGGFYWYVCIWSKNP